MSYEAIAVLMFSTFMLLLLTGQRVFGAIGFVAAAFSLALWGEGAVEMPFASTITLINWYPMLTLPMFVWMGYVMSETRMADDLYRMFHVWFGPIPGGLAIGRAACIDCRPCVPSARAGLMARPAAAW